MKKVLLVGAAGCLGKNLLNVLSNSGYYVVASDISKYGIPIMQNVEAISNDELFRKAEFKADVLINCAFARGNDVKELASALNFNEKLIQHIKKFEINAIINISSQGIYKSLAPGEFANEESEIVPNDMYSLSKYAQELLFTSNFGKKVTNVRMASLSSNARFMHFFVDNVINGKDIIVSAPSQYVSILDVRDASLGILQICNLPDEKRKDIYNLGNGQQFSILQIAQIIRDVGKEYGYNNNSIRVENRGKSTAVGMDVTKLRNDTDWEAKISVYEMIKELFIEKRSNCCERV